MDIRTTINAMGSSQSISIYIVQKGTSKIYTEINAAFVNQRSIVNGSKMKVIDLKTNKSQVVPYNGEALEAMSYVQFNPLDAGEWENPKYVSENLYSIKGRKGSLYYNSKKKRIEKYELEEVIPNNMEFDEDSCRLRLSNTMRTQYVLALEKDNVLVAKAGTNSIGYKYVQLGGVFTKPGERGRGFAKYVVSAVLIKSLRMHRVPVLFVKKQNEAAVHLYESLFFEKLGDYVIAYY